MTGDVDQSVSYARWYGALAHQEWREAMNGFPEQQQPEGQPANEPNVTTQPQQDQPQQPQQPDTQDGESNNPAPSPA